MRQTFFGLFNAICALHHATVAEECETSELNSHGRAIAQSLEGMQESLATVVAERNDALFIQQALRTKLIEKELKSLKEDLTALKTMITSQTDEKNLMSPGGQDRIFFNAYTKKRFSCHNCPITYDGVHSDSHGSVHLASGAFKVPADGNYFLQFHALAESGSEAQLEIQVNGVDVLSIYDRDIGSSNRRYAMLGQSAIKTLQKGDQVRVWLHSGALKGGGEAVFTSFIGLKVDDQPRNEL